MTERSEKTRASSDAQQSPSGDVDVADLDVAVVHGTALERGGGVQVAEELARTLDAPLYFGFCSNEVRKKVATDVEVRFLFEDSRLSRFKRNGLFRNVFYLSQFQHVPELHRFDVVVQSDNGTEWYVPPETQALVRYVHSIPGRPYHAFPEMGGSFVSKWFGFISRVLRLPNEHLADARIANSEYTQRQLRKYLDKDADVAYPPVDTTEFEPRERGEFYLSLSRLIEGKGVRELVRTFTEEHPETRLVVAGSGPLQTELEAAAGPNVEIKGWVEESVKRELLGSAKALVLNSGNESFGIVPVEAFASGTPVIGARGGYTTFQIRDGWNGLLFEPGGLSAAIARFESEGVEASPEEIAEFATRYDVENFRRTVRKAVQRAARMTAQTTDY